jgi:hypothetical protein
MAAVTWDRTLRKVRRGSADESAAQTAQVMPDGIAVQDPLMLNGPALGNFLSDPPLCGMEGFVPGFECTRGDEHRPQVRDRVARRHRVKRLVADLAMLGHDGSSPDHGWSAVTERATRPFPSVAVGHTPELGYQVCVIVILAPSGQGLPQQRVSSESSHQQIRMASN